MSENIRYDQVKITCAEDCGNAPRRELLRAFIVALACNDVNFTIETITEDIHWIFIGETVFHGKDEVFRMLEQLNDKKAAELVINNIITHGNSGSADGILHLESNISYAFCNEYRFNSLGKNAKIKEINSFVIDVSK
jgi:hypothetical protein